METPPVPALDPAHLPPGLSLRMLSVAPEARGTGKELAKALELAAQGTAPELDQPLFARAPPPPPTTVKVGKKALTARDQPQAKGLSWLLWLAPVAAGLLLAVWAWQGVSTRIERISSRAPKTSGAESPDAGTVGVGDTALAAASSSSEGSFGKEPMASDAPGKTFPGQAEPDAKGRCPLPVHVTINGLCWAQQPMGPKECEGSGYIYAQGKCYTPVFPTRRKPTSNPSDAR